jgi:hypothetical protein
MLEKNYILKASKKINVQLPNGFNTDGSKTYGAEFEALAVISPIQSEKRDEYGITDINFVLIILSDYSIENGAKITWDSKSYIVKSLKRIYDFKGQLFAYEVVI